MSYEPTEQMLFTCPSCSSILRTERAFAGTVVQCPECGVGLEVPLPTHKTQKIKRPTRSIDRPQPSSPEPPRRKKPQASPPMRRQPTRRRPVQQQQRSPQPLYYPHAPAPAVRKLQTHSPEKAAGIALLIVFVAAAFLWSQEKKVAATSIGSILPASSDRHGMPISGPLSSPPSAAGWSLQKQATVNAFQLSNAGEDSVNDMAVRENGRIVATGLLSSTAQFPHSSTPTQTLIDSRGTRNFGWVAEFSPDGREIIWFSLFGGDLIEPTKVRISSDGSIVIGGRALSRLPQTGVVPTGTGAVIAKIQFDGERVDWIYAGNRGQTEVTGLDIDDRGQIYWTAGTRNVYQSATIGRLTGQGTFARFDSGNADGYLAFDPTSADFMKPTQAGAHYAKSRAKADGYDFDGQGGLPPVAFSLSGIHQGGDLIVLPSGDFVVSGTLHYEYTLKGQRMQSTTDVIVARFSSSGRLIWSTNLYSDLDAVHAPRQRAVDLTLNPMTQEVLILAHQQGTTPNRFRGNLKGKGETTTVSWLGRLSVRDGDLLDGWYYHCAEGEFSSSGFPEFSSKPLLSDSLLEQVKVDGQGRIYLTGLAGVKTWTSPQAWKSWPASQTRGVQGVLLILSPTLNKYLYSTVLNSNPMPGNSDFPALALSENGVWVGGSTTGSGWISGNNASWSRSDARNVPNISIAHFQF